MKINYKFVTGEAVEIEVEDAIGESVIELESETYKLDRKETRRHESYSDDNDKRDTLVDESADVEGDVFNKIVNAKLMDALEKLLPQQLELVQKVFFEGKQAAAVAKELGITKQACNDRLNKIYKQLRKYF